VLDVNLTASFAMARAARVKHPRGRQPNAARRAGDNRRYIVKRRH